MGKVEKETQSKWVGDSPSALLVSKLGDRSKSLHHRSRCCGQRRFFTFSMDNIICDKRLVGKRSHADQILHLNTSCMLLSHSLVSLFGFFFIFSSACKICYWERTVCELIESSISIPTRFFCELFSPFYLTLVFFWVMWDLCGDLLWSHDWGLHKTFILLLVNILFIWSQFFRVHLRFASSPFRCVDDMMTCTDQCRWKIMLSNIIC